MIESRWMINLKKISNINQNQFIPLNPDINMADILQEKIKFYEAKQRDMFQKLNQFAMRKRQIEQVQHYMKRAVQNPRTQNVQTANQQPNNRVPQQNQKKDKIQQNKQSQQAQKQFPSQQQIIPSEIQNAMNDIKAYMQRPQPQTINNGSLGQKISSLHGNRQGPYQMDKKSEEQKKQQQKQMNQVDKILNKVENNSMRESTLLLSRRKDAWKPIEKPGEKSNGYLKLQFLEGEKIKEKQKEYQQMLPQMDEIGKNQSKKKHYQPNSWIKIKAHKNKTQGKKKEINFAYKSDSDEDDQSTFKLKGKR